MHRLGAFHLAKGRHLAPLNLHRQRGIMAYLDHSNQGLVLRRPSALASESFLLEGDPSAMQHSSLIILLMVHFQWPCLA